MKPTFAFVFHACDAYEPLYKGCVFYFNKYWGAEIPVRKYFITEEKEVQLNGFENIRSGKGAWTARLDKAIQQIGAEYIIYFQEDYWLTQKVETTPFQQIMEVVIQLKPAMLKLHNQTNDYRFIPEKRKEINGFVVERIDTKKSDFLLSHRAAIWQRDFFQEQLKKEESPWQNELFGSERLRGKDLDIYMIDYFRDNEAEKITSSRYSHYYTVAKSGKLNDYFLYFLEEMENGVVKETEMKAYLLEMKSFFENGTPLVDAHLNLNLLDRARYKWKRMFVKK